MKTEMKEFVWDFWKSERTENIRFDAESIKGFSSIKFYRFIASFEDRFKVSVRKIERVTDMKTLEENMVGAK